MGLIVVKGMRKGGFWRGILSGVCEVWVFGGWVGGKREGGEILEILE